MLPDAFAVTVPASCAAVRYLQNRDREMVYYVEVLHTHHSTNFGTHDISASYTAICEQCCVSLTNINVQ